MLGFVSMRCAQIARKVASDDRSTVRGRIALPLSTMVENSASNSPAETPSWRDLDGISLAILRRALSRLIKSKQKPEEQQRE